VTDRIEALVKKYRPDRTRVEDVAYQEMLRQELVSRGLAGIIGVKPPTNLRKEMLLEGMQQHFGSGRMWLRPGMDLLEQEMRSFPSGRHDDTLDALYYAMYHAWRPSHGLDEYMPAPVHNQTSRREHEPSWMSA
jgi:phage terminase large subunit-like protein